MYEYACCNCLFSESIYKTSKERDCTGFTWDTVCLSDAFILPEPGEKTVIFALTVFKQLQNKK